MTKRWPKGEGSVYRRKDGRVVGEYEGATGRKRCITSKTMTKAEMRAKVREALEDRDNSITHDSEGLTVAEYLDCWLESTRDTIGLRTYQRSEETARLDITPTLGKGKLEKLTAMQLDGLYRNKLKAGLSPRSVQIIHATMYKALKQAVRWQLVPRNVAEAVNPPRAPKAEINPLTLTQVKALLNSARGDRFEALYVLAVTTGMRSGELLGLQWRDVDLEGLVGQVVVLLPARLFHALDAALPAEAGDECGDVTVRAALGDVDLEGAGLDLVALAVARIVRGGLLRVRSGLAGRVLPACR